MSLITIKLKENNGLTTIYLLRILPEVSRDKSFDSYLTGKLVREHILNIITNVCKLINIKTVKHIFRFL